jgi:hypothetical protein
MSSIFDIEFITTKHDIKVGYVVVKKYCRVGSLKHDCITPELMSEEDIDEEINTLLAELEELRTIAKEKLKE